MNAETFYTKYGQHIANAQRNTTHRKYNKWPYLNLSQDTDIAIQDPGIKRKFIPFGTDYNGSISGVVYMEGKITYVSLPYERYPAISFQFSGCYMAKLCFKGKWYAFHISTSDSPGMDCKEDWKRFLTLHQADISAIVMCKPTDKKDYFDKYGELHIRKRLGNITLACLIDEDNHCYTIVYNVESASVYQEFSCCCFRKEYIRPCPLNLLCQPEAEAYFSSIVKH